MTTTKKLLAWLDDHLIELLAGFLLAFLPLYPKWPLLDALPGYIVRVRLEDFVVAFSLLLLLIQAARKKVPNLQQNPLFKWIVIYLGIGFLSCLSALFITRTVPLETIHIGKLFLHWARRVEYMSLALIFFAAVNSKESIKRILSVFVVTALLISVYGFGQKYLQWPVYSTMNREFAKGWRLVLSEHARVSSTFGGHYDLAGYTVMALSILGSIFLVMKSKLRWLSILAFIIVFATLLLTASRTSFVAYVFSITVLCGILLTKIGWKRTVLSWVLFMAISFVGFRTFGGVYDRFAHILRLDRIENYFNEQIAKIKPERKPTNTIDLPNDMSLVYTPTDVPPTPVNPPPGDDLPPDVFENIPESFPEASLSAIPDTDGSSGNENKDRTYSDTAFTYGLSSAIRFDALWPKAVSAFKTNPLLGTGYSTLLKDQVTDFTEAESTDNDYLRTLGETGLLGFVSFYGIFAFVLYHAFNTLRKSKDQLMTIFLAGFIAGLLGLMVNAIYIDIFVASKIAYITWAMIGATMGVVVMNRKKTKS